jgi:hypothetical protein
LAGTALQGPKRGSAAGGCGTAGCGCGSGSGSGSGRREKGRAGGSAGLQGAALERRVEGFYRRYNPAKLHQVTGSLLRNGAPPPPSPVPEIA